MIFGKLFNKAANKDAEVHRQELVTLVGRRTEHFYTAQKLCCSESVLLVLNEAFDGGLAQEMALRLGSGFCHGMGGAESVCGALSGAEIVLSLFLSPHQPGGLSERKFRKLSKKLHDRFEERFSSTSCKVLTEPVRHDRKARTENCKVYTGAGAELVTEILLEAKPELAEKANLAFLSGEDESLSKLVKSLRKC